MHTASKTAAQVLDRLEIIQTATIALNTGENIRQNKLYSKVNI